MIIFKLGEVYGHKIHVVKKYLDYETAENVGEFFRKVVAKHGLTPEQFQMQIRTVHFW